MTPEAPGIVRGPTGWALPEDIFDPSAWSDLDEVVRRGTQDMQAIADTLEAQRKKKPPMWAQDPTKAKRPTKGRGHRRVK